MKIIIDISDCDYEYIRNNCIVPIKYDNHIYEAIRSGTPYEERPKGQWIDKDIFGEEVYCSECGHMEKKEKFIWADVNYCYSCGADMREEKND